MRLKETGWKTPLLWLALSILTAEVASRRWKQPCTKDQECHQYYGHEYICSAGGKVCEHRPLYPLSKEESTKDIIGYIAVILVSALANAGGIGGGGMLAPVYIFLFGYTIQESIPMTKATILAGAIVNVLMIVQKKHPTEEGEYLIDYGLSSIIIPMLLAGTMIGVILAKVFPPLLILLILTVYLSRVSCQMYSK